MVEFFESRGDASIEPSVKIQHFPECLTRFLSIS